MKVTLALSDQLRSDSTPSMMKPIVTLSGPAPDGARLALLLLRLVGSSGQRGGDGQVMVMSLVVVQG